VETIRRYWFVIIPVGIVTAWSIIDYEGFLPFEGLALGYLAPVLLRVVAVHIGNREDVLNMGKQSQNVLSGIMK